MEESCMSGITPIYSSAVKIGIIIPQQQVTSIKEVIKNFPNIRVSYFYTTYPFELDESLHQFIESVESLLITDPYYFKSIKLLTFHKPIYTYTLNSNRLYELLFIHAIQEKKSLFCFDDIDRNYVQSVVNKLQLAIDFQQFTLEKDNLQDIIESHILAAGQGFFPITSYFDVYKALQEQGINCALIVPTEQEKIVTIERVLLSTTGRRDKENQVVIVRLQLHERPNSVTMRQKIIYEIQHFAQQLDGYAIIKNNLEATLITTRGSFEKETRGYKYIELLNTFEKNLNITASIGIGFGYNAAESGKHAKEALFQSLHQSHNLCYIVREDRSVIGPIDTSYINNYEQYSLSITDEKLLNIAKMASMSASHLVKLLARVRKHKKIDYTAEELAQTLNITLRSSNRILLKWMDAGLVDIIGEEKIANRGRPRRIYRMQFLEYEITT